MSSRKNKTSTAGKRAQPEVMQSQVSNIYDILSTVDKKRNNSTSNNNDDSDDGFTVVTSKNNNNNKKQQSPPTIDSDGFKSVNHSRGKGSTQSEPVRNVHVSTKDNNTRNTTTVTRNVNNTVNTNNVDRNTSLRDVSALRDVTALRDVPVKTSRKILSDDIDNVVNATRDNIDHTVSSSSDSNMCNTQTNISQDSFSDKTAKKGVYMPPIVSEGGWTLSGGSKRRNDRFEKIDKSEKDVEEQETKGTIVYYDSSVKLPGDDMKLNTPWTVWIHSNDNSDWSLESYKSIYEIDSVGSMWRFLHVLENLDKNVRQYYIMRSGITPIWEDNNNKQGGICSIMIDNMSRSRSGGDLGVDAFTAICILVLNESFVRNNQIINGLCYSIKSRSALIKLWIKDYEANKNFREVLPITILKHIDTVLSSMDGRGAFSGRSNGKSKISVQLKQIKPNY